LLISMTSDALDLQEEMPVKGRRFAKSAEIETDRGWRYARST